MLHTGKRTFTIMFIRMVITIIIMGMIITINALSFSEIAAKFRIKVIVIHWGLLSTVSAAPFLCNVAKTDHFPLNCRIGNADINYVWPDFLRNFYTFFFANVSGHGVWSKLRRVIERCWFCPPRQSRRFLKIGRSQKRQKPTFSPSRRRKEPERVACWQHEL